VTTQARRDKEYAGQKLVREKVLKIGNAVSKGFEDQRDRAEDVMDYWDAYNCVLSDRQFYNGTSQIFLPFVKDAVDARKTRFTGQLFPQSQRYVEVTTENGDVPHAQMSLLEHYVRRLKLRSQVVRPLIVNGDVEGQYTVYVGWSERTRTVLSKVLKPVTVDELEVPEDVEEPVETIEEEDLVDACPTVEIISDNDFLVLPATAQSIDEAIEKGGSVTVIRRWSKDFIKKLKVDGEIDGEMADRLYRAMGRKENAERNDTGKQLAQAAGVKKSGSDTTAVIYEIWTKMKIDGDMRLVRIYWGGEEMVLSVKLCPYWCDKVPVFSAAVEKVAGVFKGRAPLADVLDLQILANDIANEGADTGHFSAMPIIMTDPDKNPRVDSMVLTTAAIWKTSPNDTQFAQFPDMWRSMFERAQEIRSQIFQTLSVNPSMIPGSVGGKKKLNQAEVANEQQVDILQTADAVTIIEENILTPMLERFAEYDHQFRSDATTVKSFGELGRQVVMEEIEPIQMNRRYEYRWFGVEASRNAAQNQQRIAGLNVVMKVPPQLYPGYKLNVAPAIVQMVEDLFGPRIGPLIFVEEEAMSVDPEVENLMLEHGFDSPVHTGDDDLKHMQVHMRLMAAGDPHGTVRKHLSAHQKQFQEKAMQQQQTMQGGPPNPAGPAGGSSPSGPQHQGPPGMIPQDQMASAGAAVMPRKM
jgi:hypothetical protein